MNLWVRNQDKTILQKVDNLLISDGNNAGGTFNIYTNSLPAQNVLGRYKTKERALEVLDEIEERIMLINTINIAKDTDSLIACKNVLTEEKIKRLNYPYQMPKK